MQIFKGMRANHNIMGEKYSTEYERADDYEQREHKVIIGEVAGHKAHRNNMVRIKNKE